ncbi:MAG: hypothetical protein RL312_201, partial [Pseudomonadota bacterium]
MNNPSSDGKAPTGPSAEEVEEFLRAHPDFLASRPELYRALAPPRRVHGDGLTDHMAAMLGAERERASALDAELRLALDAERAGLGLVSRVRLAVLALMRSDDAPETVVQEWPNLLGLESCTLCTEPPENPGQLWMRPEQRPLPRGMVERLLARGRDVLVRDKPEETEALHGEAAALITRDALVRVVVA